MTMFIDGIMAAHKNKNVSVSTNDYCIICLCVLFDMAVLTGTLKAVIDCCFLALSASVNFQRFEHLFFNTVKPDLSGHSQKVVFKTDYSLMQVKSIAEGEHSAILLTIMLPIVIKNFVLSI